MAGIRVEGNTSGNVAEVNSNNELTIALTADESKAGYAALVSCSDDGDITGTRIARELDSSEDYRFRVGTDSLMFEETFSGTTINTSVWDTPIATATVAQAGGFITLNSGGSLTVAQGSLLRSKKHFPVYTTFPLCMEFLFNISTVSFNNALCEIGIGLIGTAPGTAAVDGALMRISANGMSLVMTNNLSEVTETFITFSALTAQGITLTNTNHGILVVGEDNITLWINDIVAAKISRAASGANVCASMQGHIFARMYNTGTNPLTALKLNIAKISVNTYDINCNKPWGHVMCGYGQNAYQVPSNAGTPGRTCAFSSYTAVPVQLTAPSATALGTGGVTGLGGIQRIGNAATPVALTADTAYITYSYLVPLPTLTNPVTPAKNLYVTAVQFQLMTRGAAGPANIGTFTVEMNFGSTNVNPATAEGATTPAKTARNIMLGMLTIPASAAVGTLATGTSEEHFSDAPVVLNPGEYLQLSIRPLVAYTISASQELLCVASVSGYWE